MTAEAWINDATKTNIYKGSKVTNMVLESAALVNVNSLIAGNFTDAFIRCRRWHLGTNSLGECPAIGLLGNHDNDVDIHFKFMLSSCVAMSFANNRSVLQLRLHLQRW